MSQQIMIPCGIAAESGWTDTPGKVHTANGISDTAQMLAAGTQTLPGTSKEAWEKVEIVIDAAQVIGIELPKVIIFLAGQVFYKNNEIEEVRLALAVPNEDESSDEATIWTTPTAPQIAYVDDQLLWNPDQEGRCHLSVILVKENNEPSKIMVLFDLRDNNPKPKRRMADPLHDTEITQSPNDPATVLFGEVIARPSRWQTNKNELCKYAQKGNAVISFHLDDEMPDAFSEQLLQKLDARFTEMKGDLVADIADILFWHWYANKRPAYVEITLAQILEYRKKIKPGQETVREHWQAMRDVRAIKLRGGGIESESLFHISAAQFDETSATNLKTVYRYHPGYFLSEAIQKDGFYIAYFARSVWQLDYFRDANAKRLARVLRAEWRRNPASYLPTSHPLAKTPRYRTIRALLTDAGIDFESGIAKTEPTRFIKSIESEIEKLYSKAEFIRDCAPTCYHPDDREKREKLPRYNPLKTWLSLRTHIAPAADITDLLAQTTTRRLALKAQLKTLAEGKKRAPQRRKAAE